VSGRSLIRCVAALAALAGAPGTAGAQETIFNVPSPDIVARATLYLETDHYLWTWTTASGHAASFLVRGVYGVGHNVEVGWNAGPFDDVHASEPFVDATAKWRPLRAGAAGLVLGDNAGVGVRDQVSGLFRNVVYGAGFVALPGSKTRLSAGPYFATAHVFTARSRWGAQVTLEQPVPRVAGLELAADWFSGDGASATTGFIESIGRVVIYAGYGFANSGRADDLATLEVGINLF
jgi:hypothetical protein